MKVQGPTIGSTDGRQQVRAKPRSSGFDDTFLHEWLATFEAQEKDRALKDKGLSATELEVVATCWGFRTYRTFDTFRKRQHVLLKRFVSEPAFTRLWEALDAADLDKRGKRVGLAFTAANGGFVASLLRRFEAWHQRPKVTLRESRALFARLSRACDEALMILNQLSPDGTTDPLLRLRSLESWQVMTILRNVSSKELWEKREKTFSAWSWDKDLGMSNLLSEAGITPAYAIGSLRETLARLPGQHGSGPTKIRASSAMRTNFIEVIDRLIIDAGFLATRPVSLEIQHVAELVGLVCNCDCSVDDVQKARVVSRLQEKKRAEDFERELKESSFNK